MPVYGSIIEIWLEPTFERLYQQNAKMLTEIRELRKLPARTFWGQELLDSLWKRTWLLNDSSGSAGYVGYDNCAFSLLYGVFGVDVIAYLFNKNWVPHTTIDPFLPALFLEKLSVLEHAGKKLKHGVQTPVLLPETKRFVRPGMGPSLSSFDEQQHRLLLEFSLRELRGFGELGLSLQNANEKFRVDMHIWIPYGDYDPDILEFAAK